MVYCSKLWIFEGYWPSRKIRLEQQPVHTVSFQVTPSMLVLLHKVSLANGKLPLMSLSAYYLRIGLALVQSEPRIRLLRKVSDELLIEEKYKARLTHDEYMFLRELQQYYGMKESPLARSLVYMVLNLHESIGEDFTIFAKEEFLIRAKQAIALLFQPLQ